MKEVKDDINVHVPCLFLINVYVQYIMCIVLIIIPIVAVTALHHFPLACGLLVGYNFGGFQIFSLADSTLLYSLPVMPRRLLPPVISFSVQEPEEDPRHFLYVWAIRKGAPPIQDM